MSTNKFLSNDFASVINDQTEVLQSELIQLNDTTDASNVELQTINTELVEQTDELLDLNAELDAQTTIMNTHTTELNDINTELNTQTTELNSINTELDSQTTIMNTQTTALNDINTELNTQTTELNSINTNTLLPQYQAVRFQTERTVDGKEYRVVPVLSSTETIFTTALKSIVPTFVADQFIFIPQVGVKLQFASTNANDASGVGTGAELLVVVGLDSSGNDIQEVVALTGLTSTTETTNSFRSIRAAFVFLSSTAGQDPNTGPNLGIIYAFPSGDAITSGVPDDADRIMGVIPIGEGILKCGCLSVPPLTNWFLTDVGVSIEGGSSNIELVILSRSINTSNGNSSGWVKTISFFGNATSGNFSVKQPLVAVGRNVGDPNTWTDIILAVQRFTGQNATQISVNVTGMFERTPP